MKRVRTKIKRKKCIDCDKRLDKKEKRPILKVCCRECLRKRDREYQRIKRATLIGYKTEEYRKWRVKNPDKYEAHKKFMNIRKKIKKQPCQDCGRKTNVQAHHPDYSKPFDVLWVCPIHHKNYHKKSVKQTKAKFKKI